jgi:hypothetical protein
VVDDSTKRVKQWTIIYEVPKVTLRERERANMLISSWMIQRTLHYLADDLVVVWHTIVDQSESIVAGTTRVGSNKKPSISLRSLLEQSNSFLHIVDIA